MQVISIKKNPKYQAGGQPKKWLKDGVVKHRKE